MKVEELVADDWARIADLTDRYSDHPLGGFDAGLVALADLFEPAQNRVFHRSMDASAEYN